MENNVKPGDLFILIKYGTVWRAIKHIAELSWMVECVDGKGTWTEGEIDIRIIGDSLIYCKVINKSENFNNLYNKLNGN